MGVFGVIVEIFPIGKAIAPAHLRKDVTTLLQDDAALVVDFDRIVGHEVGIVMHDEDAGVHDGRADKRNVEQIDGLLDTRAGVDVSAEGSADALQPVEEILVGEVLGAVEAHVLQEVGQAVLVGLFQQGARVGGEIEFGTLSGFLIVADVVGQAVVELADAGCRVIGELLLRNSRESGQKGDRGEEDFFNHSYDLCEVVIF